MAANHLCATAGHEPVHCLAPCFARSLRRKADRHSLRNSIDHALLAFGALYAGIPFCPVSPAYSLISRDYGKLAFLMKLLTPVWCSPTIPANRRRALRQCSGRNRDRRLALVTYRPQGNDVERVAVDTGASGLDAAH